jgi:hypothetical protein
MKKRYKDPQDNPITIFILLIGLIVIVYFGVKAVPKNMEASAIHYNNPQNISMELSNEKGDKMAAKVIDSFTYKNNKYAVVEIVEKAELYIFKVEGSLETGDYESPNDNDYAELCDYYDRLCNNK